MAEKDAADAVTTRRVEEAPLLRVVKGDATEEEIAALVGVLASLGTTSAPPPRRSPEWQAPRRRVRPALAPGPGGWRVSGLPR